MSMTLDAYRAKLVIIILYAESADAIERYIDTAVHALKSRKINAYVSARFIAKLGNQFEVITRSATEHQLNNIKVAKNCLKKLTGRTGD